MVRFTKYLEIIEEENLVENARQSGNYLLKKLNEIESEYSKFITNSRGRGLFCAMDFPTKEDRDLFRQKCYDNGLILLGCGNSTVRFRPALNVKPEEIDEAIIILKKAIEEVRAAKKDYVE
jgi:L-lysine 6-transaminase